MDKIVVEGQQKLEGEVSISGAKNAALPIVAATLLANGTSSLSNVPNLMDIRTICALLEDFGAKVNPGPGTLELNCDGVNNFVAAYELVSTMRASVLVLGPLTTRFGQARVSLPGGCAIGSRPIELHLKGLEAMGATIEMEHGYVVASAPDGLKGADIFLDFPTVTGTENILMAAVLAHGDTVIRNAAREPEISDLAAFLKAMGAKISGAGTDVIKVEGVDTLNGASYSIMSDRIEAGTFMVAAGITASEITIKNAPLSCLTAVESKLTQAGLTFRHLDESTVIVSGPEKIKSIDLKTEPYPGFPTDMQAQTMALMSLANGLSVIVEDIFENRFIHVSELERLGAEIKLSGNTAIIQGASNLSGAPVMATDLRASASLILAGLAAVGQTEISRVYHLDRGYEKIEEKLSGLGAQVRRLKARK